MTPIVAGIISGIVIFVFTYMDHMRSDVDDDFEPFQGIKYAIVASLVTGGLVYIGGVPEQTEEILTQPFESFS